MDLKTERLKAVVTLIVDGLLLYNMVAASKGWSIIPTDHDAIYEAVSAALMVAACVYTWWKNQNLTEAACVGQETVMALKEAEKNEHHGEDLL